MISSNQIQNFKCLKEEASDTKWEDLVYIRRYNMDNSSFLIQLNAQSIKEIRSLANAPHQSDQYNENSIGDLLRKCEQIILVGKEVELKAQLLDILSTAETQSHNQDNHTTGAAVLNKNQNKDQFQYQQPQGDLAKSEEQQTEFDESQIDWDSTVKPVTNHSNKPKSNFQRQPDKKDLASKTLPIIRQVSVYLDGSATREDEAVSAIENDKEAPSLSGAGGSSIRGMSLEISDTNSQNSVSNIFNSNIRDSSKSPNLIHNNLLDKIDEEDLKEQEIKVSDTLEESEGTIGGNIIPIKPKQPISAIETESQQDQYSAQDLGDETNQDGEESQQNLSSPSQKNKPSMNLPSGTANSSQPNFSMTNTSLTNADLNPSGITRQLLGPNRSLLGGTLQQSMNGGTIGMSNQTLRMSYRARTLLKTQVLDTLENTLQGNYREKDNQMKGQQANKEIHEYVSLSYQDLEVTNYTYKLEIQEGWSSDKVMKNICAFIDQYSEVLGYYDPQPLGVVDPYYIIISVQSCIDNEVHMIRTAPFEEGISDIIEFKIESPFQRYHYERDEQKNVYVDQSILIYSSQLLHDSTSGRSAIFIQTQASPFALKNRHEFRTFCLELLESVLLYHSRGNFVSTIQIETVIRKEGKWSILCFGNGSSLFSSQNNRESDLKQQWRDNLSDWARVVIKIFLLYQSQSIEQIRDMIANSSDYFRLIQENAPEINDLIFQSNYFLSKGRLMRRIDLISFFATDQHHCDSWDLALALQNQNIFYMGYLNMPMKDMFQEIKELPDSSLYEIYYPQVPGLRYLGEMNEITRQREGQGKLIIGEDENQTIIYEGGFFNDLPHGLGRICSFNNLYEYQGLFFSGCFGGAEKSIINLKTCIQKDEIENLEDIIQYQEIHQWIQFRCIESQSQKQIYFYDINFDALRFFPEFLEKIVSNIEGVTNIYYIHFNDQRFENFTQILNPSINFSITGKSYIGDKSKLNSNPDFTDGKIKIQKGRLCSSQNNIVQMWYREDLIKPKLSMADFMAILKLTPDVLSINLEFVQNLKGIEELRVSTSNTLTNWIDLNKMNFKKNDLQFLLCSFPQLTMLDFSYCNIESQKLQILSKALISLDRFCLNLRGAKISQSNLSSLILTQNSKFNAINISDQPNVNDRFIDSIGVHSNENHNLKNLRILIIDDCTKISPEGFLRLFLQRNNPFPKLQRLKMKGVLAQFERLGFLSFGWAYDPSRSALRKFAQTFFCSELTHLSLKHTRIDDQFIQLLMKNKSLQLLKKLNISYCINLTIDTLEYLHEKNNKKFLVNINLKESRIFTSKVKVKFNRKFSKLNLISCAVRESEMSHIRQYLLNCADTLTSVQIDRMTLGQDVKLLEKLLSLQDLYLVINEQRECQNLIRELINPLQINKKLDIQIIQEKQDSHFGSSNMSSTNQQETASQLAFQQQMQDALETLNTNPQWGRILYQKNSLFSLLREKLEPKRLVKFGIIGVYDENMEMSQQLVNSAKIQKISQKINAQSVCLVQDITEKEFFIKEFLLNITSSVQRIDLSGTEIDDFDCQTLSQTETLQNLEQLILNRNPQITLFGLYQIFQSSNFPKLKNIEARAIEINLAQFVGLLQNLETFQSKNPEFMSFELNKIHFQALLISQSDLDEGKLNNYQLMAAQIISAERIQIQCFGNNETICENIIHLFDSLNNHVFELILVFRGWLDVNPAFIHELAKIISQMNNLKKIQIDFDELNLRQSEKSNCFNQLSYTISKLVKLNNLKLNIARCNLEETAMEENPLFQFFLNFSENGITGLQQLELDFDEIPMDRNKLLQIIEPFEAFIKRNTEINFLQLHLSSSGSGKFLVGVFQIMVPMKFLKFLDIRIEQCNASNDHIKLLLKHIRDLRRLDQLSLALSFYQPEHREVILTEIPPSINSVRIEMIPNRNQSQISLQK